MNKQIGFHHGALCDDYEKQANEQGYTLGKYAETAKKIRLWFSYKSCSWNIN